MNIQNVGAEKSNLSAEATKKATVTPAVETAAAQKTAVEEKDFSKLSSQELRVLAEEMNRHIEPLTTDIRFGFSDEIDGLFVNIIDARTNKIIRQLPSKEALEMSARMRELIGMIFDKTI